MRLAHIVLAHTLPEQLIRLVGALTHPDDQVLIHIDRGVEIEPFQRALGSLPGQRGIAVLPRTRCAWGGFGLVAATLTGVRTALAHADPPDVLHLLSGQDLPLAGRDAWVRRLTDRPGAVYLRHRPLPDPGFVDGDGMDRLERRYLRPSRRWSLPNRLVPWFPRRRIPAGLRPHHGSQFWWMPADVARDLLARIDADPTLERFFRRSFVPDETFFQTLVLSGPHRDRVVDDDLLFVDHPAGDAHPRLLTTADVDAARHSGALFARKFDATRDPGVLDALLPPG